MIVMKDVVSLNDVREARKRIGNFVKRTPLVRSEFLSSFCGGAVFLKLENEQIGNSFKVRGAFNRIFNASAREKRLGVITASAGNFAMGIGSAADELKIPVKIVVPKSTPKVKIENIMKHKVELVMYGDIYDEAEHRAIELAKEVGLTYVSPYNDRFIIAGNGTIGLEILEDLPSVATVIVPTGGGGLISGISCAIKSIKPSVEILGVQSEASSAMYASLKAGKIVDVEMRDSIAEGLFGGIEKGSVTFGLVQKCVDEIVWVKEETLRKAIHLLWDKERKVAEGSGAAAIAPILENRKRFAGKTIVAVISGGNIDEELFQEILASDA